MKNLSVDSLTAELPLFQEDGGGASPTSTHQSFKNYVVRELSNKKLAYPYIYEIHYAKRKPSLSYVYGLYKNYELIGVCTFGSPASPNLCEGIAGKNNRNKVIELNRLVLKFNRKNEASFLVSKSIRMLPKPKIIVSYADTAQGHVGLVYQATNFFFTGTTKARTDMASANNKHSRHSLKDPTNRVFRSAKHRYVYIHADKQEKANLRNELNYKISTYPKSSNEREVV